MTIVPIYSESANYKEWEFVADDETYTIVCDNGIWVLFQHVEGTWVEVGDENAIEVILQHLELLLA